FANLAPEPERESREQAEQEMRQVRGVRVLVVAYCSFLLTLFLFGLAVAKLRGQNEKFFGLTLLVLFILSALLGGWGIYTLWKSKFFRSRHDRLIKAYALLLEQGKNPGRVAPKPVMPSEVSETSSFHSPVAPISIAEPTTRELQPMTSDSGKIA